MLQIIKNCVVIATVNNPTYVCKMDNGCFALCSEAEAQGVVVEGEVFHIAGRPDLEGAEDIQLVEKNETEHVITEKRAMEETNNVTAIAFVSLAEAGTIDEVTAGEHREMFAPWAVGVSYIVGNIRTYGEGLYKCVQAHTSQADWTPDAAASLWVNIADPSEEYPVWSQPIGAHDAYITGDKVTHNEKKWLSTVDGNVWEPGVYGWEEITE